MIEQYFEILQTKSDLARNLIKACKFKSIRSTTVGPSYYDEIENILILNCTQSSDVILKNIVLLLREAYHQQNNHYIPILSLEAPDAVLYNRCINADKLCILFRVAWELKLSSHNDLYNLLKYSYDENIKHIFKDYEREVQKDFRQLKNGNGFAFILENIFLHDGINEWDTNLIHEMLASNSYFTTKLIDLSRTTLIKLGKIPQEINYIEPHVYTIMSDPIFTEIRGRSNSNFLWFIRFEQNWLKIENEMKEQKPINEKVSGFSDNDFVVIECADKFKKSNKNKTITQLKQDNIILFDKWK